MPNLARIIFALMGCIITASCTFNAGYTPKKPIQIPRKWHVKDKHLITQNNNMACIAWWKQFHDPVLNQLVETGLEQNNNLQIAIAHIEAAQGELKRVELNWIPSMSGDLGYSSFPYLGYPGVLAAIVPTYTLNIFSQIKEQKRAQSELKVTENMRDTVKLAVIAQITGSYFSYLAEMERLILLKQIERDLTETMTIAQSTYQQGLTTHTNLAKAKSHLELIQSSEMVIQKNIVTHQNAIRYLLNENPEQFKFHRKFSQINSHQMILGALPLNVIENRPDMMQAMNELKAANARASIAVSHFLPSIQLSAARGDIATIPNGTTLGTPIYFNQALLETPLLTFSTFGEWDKAKGLSKASYYRYQDILRQVLRDVNNDLAAHEYNTQRLEQTLLAEENLNEAYHLNRQLYQQGIMSYEQLLKERVQLDKIKIKVNQHKLEQLMSIVNLYQNLGVGYGCNT